MRLQNTSIRFAWRDLIASPRRAVATVAILTAATAALYTARAIALETGQFIEGDPRTWVGADVVAAISGSPQPEVLQAISHLRYTISAECLTIVSSEHAADPVVVTLRAVDPQVYPFYGTVEIDPPQPFPRALTADTVILNSSILQRLNIPIGGSVQIGAAKFRAVGILRIEPDRLASIQSAYPRAILSRAGFERSRIPVGQSHVSYRFLFRNTGTKPLEEFYREIDALFPEATVSDYRHVDPRVARVFDTVIVVFHLSAWCALALATIAAALLLYVHIERRLDTVAILKALGASNVWLIRGYAIQTLGLSIAGSVCGLMLGYAATRGVAAVERRYLALPVAGFWSPSSAILAMAIVVASAVLVTAVPLQRLREIKPLRLLRRFFSEDEPRHGRATLFASAALAAIALWLAQSVSIGLAFVCSIGAFGLLLSVSAPLLLRVAQFAARGPMARYAASSLTRPGNHTAITVSLMAIGAFAMLAPRAIQPKAALELSGALMNYNANLLVPGLRRDQAENLASLFPGAASLRPHAFVRPQGISARIAAGCSNDLPWGAAILSKQNADRLRVTKGATLNLAGGGRRFAVHIDGVKPMDALSHARFGLTLSCTGFDLLNPSYEVEIRVDDKRQTAAVRTIQNKFSGFPILQPREYAEHMSYIAARGMNALQVITALSPVCGLMLLVVLTYATHRRRMHETAVLKALGARRRRLLWLFAMEYGSAGAVAGLMGGLLATAAVGAVEVLLLRKPSADWAWHLIPVSIVATAALSAGVGVSAIWQMVPRSPMELLRDNG